MRKIIISLVSGFIAGMGLTYYLINSNETIRDISVKSISGNPLIIKNTDAGKSSLKITTEYEGKGASELDIPYTSIPAANKWLNNRYSIHAYYSTDKTLMIGLGYRINRLTLSSGIYYRYCQKSYTGMWFGCSWAFDL